MDDDADIQGGCDATKVDEGEEGSGLPFLGKLNPYLKPDKNEEEPPKFDFSYYGGFDSEGLLHGNAMLVVKNHTKGQ